MAILTLVSNPFEKIFTDGIIANDVAAKPVFLIKSFLFIIVRIGRKDKKKDESGANKIKEEIDLVIDHSNFNGVNVTGPSKPDGLGCHLTAVNNPSAPRFSARRDGILIL